MKYLYTFLFFCGLIYFNINLTYLTAQDNKIVPNEVKKKCDSFFESVISGKTLLAYKTLLEKSPAGKDEEKINSLVTETDKASDLYGKMKSYELASSEIITTSFLRLRYLSNHNDLPMRWIFTIYHSPERGWIVINVKFDDQAQNFFTDQ